MPLTTERKTEAKYPVAKRVFPVAAGVRCFRGGLACINAAGYATPGAVATGLIAVGKFTETVDNRDGSDGDLFVEVESDKAYPWNNSTGSGEITQAHVGDEVFIVDDETVSLENPGGNTRSPAGTVWEVTSEGVYVLPTARG